MLKREYFYLAKGQCILSESPESPPPAPPPKFLLNMVYFRIEIIEKGDYLVDWEVQNG